MEVIGVGSLVKFPLKLNCVKNYMPLYCRAVEVVFTLMQVIYHKSLSHPSQPRNHPAVPNPIIVAQPDVGVDVEVEVVWQGFVDFQANSIIAVGWALLVYVQRLIRK